MWGASACAARCDRDSHSSIRVTRLATTGVLLSSGGLASSVYWKRRHPSSAYTNGAGIRARRTNSSRESGLIMKVTITCITAIAYCAPPSLQGEQVRA